ncbi:MAG: type II secretion system F family protein, partial [Pseudomonadota bacterium]
NMVPRSPEASPEAAMFDKGAAYMESEFEQTSKVALSLIEPLITVVMGALVLLIILAIMLPILQLNTGAFL